MYFFLPEMWDGLDIDFFTSRSYSFVIRKSWFLRVKKPQYQFLLDTTGEDTQFIRAEQEGYSWMDASLKKSFFGESLQLTLGARNLFNLTRIANQTLTGGVHSTANNGLLIGYGRSYFLKILYNLNI